MIKCPYCDRTFKNKGIRGHITKMHPEQPNPYDRPNPIVEPSADTLDEQAISLGPEIVEHEGEKDGTENNEIVVEQSDIAGGECQFVHHKSSSIDSIKPKEVQTPPASFIETAKVQNDCVNGDDETAKVLLNERNKIAPDSAKLQNNFAKLRLVLQRKPKAEKHDATVPPISKGKMERKKNETAKRPPMEKDPESLISLMLSIPTWALILGIPLFLYYSYDGLIAFLESSDLGTILIWSFQNIGDTGAKIILVMVGIVVIVALVLFYKIVWRMAFKDFQIKYASPRFMAHGDLEEGDDINIVGGARRVFIPATYEGRVYASIGFGFWDRLYRKWFNVERPEHITLFVHRTWKPVNPFKPLSSCDKIYLDDPTGVERIYKDGKFRTTTIATRMVRMSEDNAIVYWLDDGAYPQDKFNSKWYNDLHSQMLDNGLKKVSKGSLVNPDIQQDQMRRNMLWLPPQDIEAEKQLLELKKKKEVQR